MTKRIFIVSAVAGALLLGGCSEAERREIRVVEERIAAEAARQQRLAAEYVANLAEDTKRLANELDAETSRQLHRNMTVLGQLAAVLAALGGVIGFVVYSVRRLGERVSEERTKRHDMTVRAIAADPHLRPDHREKLYLRAVEAGNQGGVPRLGYGGGA